MERLHKIAEEVFCQKLEVIDTYFEDTVQKGANVPVYFLGKSIMKLAEADYFIGFSYDWTFDKEHPGCANERNIADEYEIPMCTLDPIQFGIVKKDDEEDE